MLELVQLEDLTELTFDPTSHLFWSSDRGDLVFAGWQGAAPIFGTGHHWHVRGRSLTAFAGYLWPTGGEWTTEESWADQLASWSARHPLAQSADRLTGVYVAVAIAAEGTGCITSDPLGLGVLYLGETDDISVVSNRASVTARMITGDHAEPARDPIGVGWLTYCGHIVGDRTGFAGVRTVPPGSYLAVDPDRGLRLHCRSDTPWRSDEAPGSFKTEGPISLVRDDLASAIRTAVTLPSRQPSVDLTGGKDTRLILAVLISEGLSARVTFRTVGPASSRDAVLARDIAQRFGLAHEHGFSEPALRALAGDLDFDERVRIHAFLTSGMLDAWDLQCAPLPRTMDVSINGLCGEALRTHYPGLPIMHSPEELTGRFRALMRFDTLNLIRAEHRAFYDQEMTRSLLADPSGDSSPNDLADAFHIKHSLRRKMGTTQEITDANRVTPLYSLVGLRTAFALGGTSRHNEVIHFTIIRECSEELAKLPFAKGGWREELFHDLPDAADYRAAFAEARANTRRQAFRTVRQQFNAQTLGTNQQVFEKYLTAERDDPVFEVVDRQAVAAALHRPQEELSRGARVQLFGALTAAVWLGHHDRSFRAAVS